MWVKVDCKNSMGLAFEHDGIVASFEANPEQVIVIHYAPVGIAETTLSQFMKMGDNARIVSCYCSRGYHGSAFLLTSPTKKLFFCFCFVLSPVNRNTGMATNGGVGSSISSAFVSSADKTKAPLVAPE